MQKTDASATDDAAGPLGTNVISVEDHADGVTKTDNEEAPVTEQGGKVSEIAEVLVVKEPLPATSPVTSDRSPVFEEKEKKQEAFKNELMTQPASSKKEEKVDMPEKSFPAAGDMSGEKKAAGSAGVKRSETKADSPAPLATGNKPVIVSSGQSEQKNELTKGEMPVPAENNVEPERGATAQALPTLAGTRQEEQPARHQKAAAMSLLPLSTAPETGEKVTLPSKPKSVTSQKPTGIRVPAGPNLSVSEEKPRQDFSARELSSEMTLAAAEEKASSQAREKVGTTNPPALEVKETGKDDTPKADLSLTKQNAETARKPELPKAVTISGEARVNKKAKPEKVEENLLSKDHAIVQNNEKAPVAKNGNTGVVATRTSSPARSSGSGSITGNKNDVGLDKPVVSSPSQAGKKPIEADGPSNDSLKQAHGPLAESVGIGQQKPAMGMKTDAEKSLFPARLAGSETDKKNAKLHLADNPPGPLASVSGVSSERPSAGTEVKLPITRAAGGSPPHAEGAATKFDSHPENQGQSTDGKAARSESTVPPDPGKETEKSRIGIPVSEALIQKDIKIKLVVESAGMSDVLTQLFRKAHPGLRGRRDRGKPEPVEGTVETRLPSGTDKTGTRLIAVTKAEKGVYTLVLENKGKKALTMSVGFLFYEGRGKERGKEYKGREILPGDLLRFVFIMPEAFFWDDEDRFSGSVEDSRSITKFHSESGLVWKEEK